MPEQVKYYRICLKSKTLHDNFNLLKIPNNLKNADEIMDFLQVRASKVQFLEEKITELENNIEDKREQRSI